MSDQEAPGGGGAGVGRLHGGLQETVTQQGAQVSWRKYTLVYCTLLMYRTVLVPFYTALPYTALYCTLLHYTILSYTILYCHTLCCSVLHYNVLSDTGPYFPTLYSIITVLYCTALE